VKVDDTKYDVEVQGVTLRKNFNIAVTKKAFDILSSGLYANKIAAPIRELSTNAFDSHVEAGKRDKPFEVHLPNSLEPFFSIRDYGVGMSADKIEHLYSTYFGSDKTNSNELVGCMGLGSKSPYAYCDQFTVTSWHNGTQYIYVCLKNEFGIPELNKFGQSASKEPNGVEIKFAVNQKDFDTFKQEAENIYKWFSPHPAVKGNSYYKQRILPKFTLEGDDWKIVTTVGDYYSQTVSHAIMGNIAYPIKTEQITNNTSSYNQDRYSILLRNGCYLYFKIGELEMTASREDLEYVPKVITAIKNRLDTIIASIGKILSDELAKQKNKWEARIFCGTLQTVYSPELFCLIEKQGHLKFNGEKISTGGIVLDFGSTGITGINSYSRNTYRNKTTIGRNINHIPVVSTIKFCLHDEPDKPEVRIANYLEINNNNIIITFDKTVWSDVVKFLKIKDTLGIDDTYFGKVSDLPLPPKTPRVKSGVKIDRSKIEVWKYSTPTKKSTSSYYSSYSTPHKASFWHVEMVPWNAVHIYVEINDWYWTSGSHYNESPNKLEKTFEKLDKIGIKRPVLYGVKTAKLERVKKLKWQPFQEWIKDEIKKVIQKNNFKEAIKNNECLKVLQRAELYKKSIRSITLQNGKFKDFAEKISNLKVPNLDRVEATKEMAAYCGLSDELNDTTLSQSVLDFQKEEAELQLEYPVLPLIDSSHKYWNDKNYENLVKCINALEIQKFHIAGLSHIGTKKNNVSVP
jgi:hypothetical protein